MSRYPYGIAVQARLRKLCRNQKQLATALGYTPGYLSMILRGKRRPYETICRIDRQLAQWESQV